MRWMIWLLAAGCAAGATPTFNKDIAPILYQNCTECHRTGEVAPFPLVTYQDTAKRASVIAAVTKQRVMPLWKPDAGHFAFLNERRLTDEQIAMLADWAKAGAPEGDPKDRPAPPVFSEGWKGGKPDQVLTMPAKFTVSPDGPDQFRCFVMPMKIDDTVYVSGIEFKPGNRRVVHHALVYLDSSGVAKKKAEGSADGSYPCFGGPGFLPSGALGGWAPGAAPGAKIAGLAHTLKPGMDVVVQIHYHPSGKPEADQSSVGMVYSGPPTKGQASVLVLNRNIDIPAGDAHHVVKASVMLPRDVDVVGITPHAHYLARDMKVTAIAPDGKSTSLIRIPDWDFNWQGQYAYKEPVHLVKGTRVEIEYVYDNSAGNPHNPTNPPAEVTWGEETKNEMALVFLRVELPKPEDVPEFQREMRRELVKSVMATRSGNP
jgi:hypothetical protein